eukprot:CAMPEP_0172607304 /NCGR_PEP_ID=MMETSP1068-20121228/27505_1 /TAXON_ID=35684 /ORGANISM="Pseudopedinella elastica, Strain CCMP716" /LENGTH=187 /DNA_ID=CAMNT_0013410269 /DNA_START=34 /DNA_END=597 /DNA_ORIENTATION=+
MKIAPGECVTFDWPIALSKASTGPCSFGPLGFLSLFAFGLPRSHRGLIWPYPKAPLGCAFGCALRWGIAGPCVHEHNMPAELSFERRLQSSEWSLESDSLELSCHLASPEHELARLATQLGKTGVGTLLRRSTLALLSGHAPDRFRARALGDQFVPHGFGRCLGRQKDVLDGNFTTLLSNPGNKAVK